MMGVDCFIPHLIHTEDYRVSSVGMEMDRLLVVMAHSHRDRGCQGFKNADKVLGFWCWTAGPLAMLRIRGCRGRVLAASR